MNSYHFARIETFNVVLETYFLAFEQFSELFLALRLQKKIVGVNHAKMNLGFSVSRYLTEQWLLRSRQRSSVNAPGAYEHHSCITFAQHHVTCTAKKYWIEIYAQGRLDQAIPFPPAVLRHRRFREV